VKKAKCVTIDVSILAEAEEAAAKLGIPFSALVEEALRRLLRQAEAWRGVEEKLANIETLLRQCLEVARREPPQAPAEEQKPPQQRTLSNNIWVEILRRR
jgi:post-segregation antitoxin (ccd killing protein)